MSKKNIYININDNNNVTLMLHLYINNSRPFWSIIKYVTLFAQLCYILSWIVFFELYSSDYRSKKMYFEFSEIIDYNKDRKRKSKEERKEERGRTVIHPVDSIRIPFWEISVELRGILKHYKKRYQMKSSLKGKNDKYKYLTRSEYIIIQNMFMNTRTERERERKRGTYRVTCRWLSSYPILRDLRWTQRQIETL